MSQPPTPASTWSKPQCIALSRPFGAVLREHVVTAARDIVATWRRWSLPRRDAYLSQAADVADLERRMRAWDDLEAPRARWPRLP